MRRRRTNIWAVGLLGLGCAGLTGPGVQAFGPGSFTTHAYGAPSVARAEVIGTASRFCGAFGERSLPSDLVLVALPQGVHSVTMVFRCSELGNEEVGL